MTSTPEKISHTFKDKALLKLALSHRSYGKINNERLEFLGDSILGFIIAEILFQRFPQASEGELSRLRAELVKKHTLADIARELSLGESLILGLGEAKSGGAKRDSILADALEAVVSAIYLDAGISACRKEVLSWFVSRLRLLESDEEISGKDAKTRLQELLQSKQLALPKYLVSELEGKDHEQQFTVSCKVVLCNKAIKGQGTSRREAEQHAASLILEKLGL
ncbi:MAG: ribonuclease III [Gammaproteobacteria bacterium]|nr:ribonuclease III [Gammaproteobacteria bacterium]